MCELGSQGGMDGRWHCSAAQVEILLSLSACRYASFYGLAHPAVSFFLPVIVHFCPSSCQHACKEGDRRRVVGG